MMHGWNGRGYYEVQVKLLLGAFVGTVGSIVVLARSVAGILSPDGVCTQHAVRAGRIEGLMLCVALPAGVMAAHYVVQPNRYYLATVSGCTATIFTSWPAIVLLFIWPPIPALFAAYYGCTSLSLHPTCRTPPVLTMDEGVMLWRLARYKKRVRGLVGSNVLQMSVARFARLAVFALVLALLYVPAAFFTLSINPNHQFYPYNWAAMHDADAWRLDAIPRNPATSAAAAAAAAARSGRFGVDRCLAIGTGLLVFAVFGVGRETLALYCSWIATLAGLARQLAALPANLCANSGRADHAVKECDLESCSSSCSSSELWVPLAVLPPSHVVADRANAILGHWSNPMSFPFATSLPRSPTATQRVCDCLGRLPVSSVCLFPFGFISSAFVFFLDIYCEIMKHSV